MWPSRKAPRLVPVPLTAPAAGTVKNAAASPATTRGNVTMTSGYFNSRRNGRQFSVRSAAMVGDARKKCEKKPLLFGSEFP